MRSLSEEPSSRYIAGCGCDTCPLALPVRRDFGLYTFVVDHFSGTAQDVCLCGPSTQEVRGTFGPVQKSALPSGGFPGKAGGFWDASANRNLLTQSMGLCFLHEVQLDQGYADWLQELAGLQDGRSSPHIHEGTLFGSGKPNGSHRILVSPYFDTLTHTHMCAVPQFSSLSGLTPACKCWFSRVAC